MGHITTEFLLICFLLSLGFFSIFKVDVEEVMYVAKELWHCRSARDQSIKEVGRGMWRSVNELMLVRYVYHMVSKMKPGKFQFDNIVNNKKIMTLYQDMNRPTYKRELK